MEELLACRACLATGVKLHNMRSQQLVNAYESLTGIKMTKPENYPEYLCSYCTTLLLKSISFRDKCVRAMDLLNMAVLQSGMLTQSDILNVDRRYNNLVLPYVCESLLLNVKEESSPIPRDESDVESDNDFEDDNDAQTDACDTREAMSSEDEPLSVKVERKNQNEESKDVPNLKQDEFQSVNIECITLTKEEQIAEVLARKNSVNYQNSLYKCDKCYKGFITDVTFKNHMFRHDPAAGPHACAACHTRWESARALRSHTLAAHARKFVCRACAHVTRSRHRATEHAHWHNGHTFRCKVCGSTFSKSTSYLTHLRLQHPSQHRCELCGEAFLGPNGLNIHKKKAHRDTQSQRPQLPCAACGAVFHCAAALQFHASLPAPLGCGSALRPCAECGHSFLSDERLREHLRAHHGVGSLQCEHCNRTFAHKRSIAVHHQRVHLGVKLALGKDARGKVFVVCEICGKKCISKASLVDHQRIHSGEKPFQCPECPKKFSVCQRLQIHLRTHTGERPFKCAICPKAFMHKAALNRHDRVHTGVKPYTCSHCGRAFSQSNSMKLHVRTVHLKLPAPYRSRRKLNEGG
ncbi:zinc finger protein 79 isoform X2 [Manduca sexta]|uniref:zinc finger protein 79 isoform X2 n=1 Tax=Manduca sexta TaxID=7130 RepID=UPI001183CA2A|nr:zinc finger protein 79 isoform X2 [Manduca sexta]